MAMSGVGERPLDGDANMGQPTTGGDLMPRPVIMLQDGAVDELMSVALLTTMPTNDIDYLGCLVVNGDCLTPPTVSVTQKILGLMGRLDPTLPTNSFVGAVEARAVNAFPWTYRQYSLMANMLPILNDGGQQPSLPSAPGLMTSAEVAAMMLAAVEERGERLTILSLGPLTPLARALEVAGQPLLDAIGELVWMGGALPPKDWKPGDAPFGNVDPGIAVGANPNAEWNSYWDPYAVDTVFRSGMTVRMFPLNVTNLYPLDAAFFGKYIYPNKRFPIVDLAGQMYSTVAFEAGYCFWDTVTTASLGDRSLFEYEERRLTIDTDYSSDSFGTIVEALSGGSPILVARQGEHAKSPSAFYDYYVGRLTSVPPPHP
jgi:purine nucleosidase